MDCPLEARLTDDDRTVLQQNVEDMVRFALAGDWEAYASLHTDDVTMMPANADLFTGRETLVEAYAGLTFSEFSANLVYADGCGDVAYGRGQTSYALSVADIPESVSASVKWVLIWRKQDDGRWLIELDIDNADSAPDM
jgi:ketosteroid isomerase-like protein